MEPYNDSEVRDDLRYQTINCLIQSLNSHHKVGFGRTQEYILQDLYHRIFEELSNVPIDVLKAGNSNKLKKAFTTELAKMKEQYQNRFEIIMSNNEVKTRIIGYLSEQVYNQLCLNTNESELKTSRRE